MTRPSLLWLSAAVVIVSAWAVGCGSSRKQPREPGATTARWAKALTSPGYSGVRAVAVDGSTGDIWVAGAFTHRISMGGLRSQGGDDGFLARLSASGSVRWATRVGGRGADALTAAEPTGFGGVVVAGSFVGRAEVGEHALTGRGNPAAFVAQYDANGKPQWVRVLDASDFVTVLDIAVDPSDGGIAISGTFAGELAAGGQRMSSAGVQDAFVARLDSRGTVEWSRRGGGVYPDYAHGVAARDGKVVAVGSFGVEADFGDDTPTQKGTKRSLDAFVALYQRGGKLAWVRSGGGPGTDRAMEVDLDARGGICHAGTFMGEARFGGPALRADRIDAYVACLDGRGQHRWSTRLAGTGDETVRQMVRSGDTLAVLGDYNGALVTGGTRLDSAGKHDVFLAVIAEGGQRIAARSIGGGKAESAGGVAAHPNGTWIVGGSFSGTPGLAGVPLTAEGRINGFVLATGL